MIDFFIDRPIFSTVLSIVITLAGAIALTQLPIARFPNITPPTIAVSTTFPGANAETVEQSVAAPIEQKLSGVSHMLYFDSKSGNDGSYTASITFDVGSDQDIAAVEVQNRISIANRQLPADVLRQGVVVQKRNPQVLLLVCLRSTSERYDDLFLSNYATINLYDALARVPGVGQVVIFGARDYGMRIWLDPDKMSALRVTTQDVESALQQQNIVAPAGRIGAQPAPPGQQKEYPVQVRGRLTDPAQYAQITLRGNSDGTIVRLGDVARVELAATDYTRASLLDGVPVANIGVYQLPDANALDVAKSVRSTMQQLSKRFPRGIEYTIPYDTTLFVSASLESVVHTLFEAALLVLFVVFLFLESGRATLIPMLVVPVSLLGALTAFLLFGFSINTLTLFAMVLAIGLVVDDAIVVVEASTQKMESHGLSARDATKAAMADVSGPVVAIALVLSSVFIPVAFLGGITGQLYRQFALTLSVAVLISALIALTFTPALCALLLRPAAEARWRGPIGWFFGNFRRGFAKLTARYTRGVSVVLRRWAIAAVAFVALTAVTLWLVERQATGFVPDEDQGVLMVAVTLPPGASQQRTQRATEQFRKLLRAKVREVENVVTIDGFGLLAGVNASNLSTIFLPLRAWDQRKDPSSGADALVQRISRLAAGRTDASFIVLNPAPIPGLGQAGGFEFVLEDRSGGTLTDFDQVLRDFLARSAHRPELARVFTQLSNDTPQIEYELDRDRAQTLGLGLADVVSSLQTFLGGAYVNDFNLYGRTYHVTAQAEAAARASPEAISHFYVRSQSGEMVPLSTLATIKSSTGPQYVERFNVFRAATLIGSAAPGRSSGDAVNAMEQLAAGLPQGYAYDWSGTTYQEKKSAGQAPIVFALALVFVFLVLAAQYESWAVPLAVMLGIPFAVFGAFLGLSARNMANDIYAQIGLIMLIGLSAKNSILIVEFARIAHARGTPLVEAAVYAARLRLRPILMTSFAFVLGTMPLMFAGGAGAASRAVLGTTVVCGMTAATLIGIFLVPMFYVLIQGLAERLHRKPQPRGGQPSSALGPVPGPRGEPEPAHVHDS